MITRIIAGLLLIAVPQFAVPTRTYTSATSPLGACVAANASGTAMTITLNIAPNSVTVISYGNTNRNGATINSLTDTLGQSWVYVGGNYAGTAGLAWYCSSCKGGTDTITLGFSSSYNSMQIFAGVNYPLMTGAVATQDTAAVGVFNTGATSQSTGSYSTTNAADYVFAQNFVGSPTTTMTPVSSSGTLSQDYQCIGSLNRANDVVMTFNSKIATSTATYNQTYTYNTFADNSSQSGIFSLKHS